jgi:hypothetical protein
VLLKMQDEAKPTAPIPSGYKAVIYQDCKELTQDLALDEGELAALLEWEGLRWFKGGYCARVDFVLHLPVADGVIITVLVQVDGIPHGIAVAVQDPAAAAAAPPPPAAAAAAAALPPPQPPAAAAAIPPAVHMVSNAKTEARNQVQAQGIEGPLPLVCISHWRTALYSAAKRRSYVAKALEPYLKQLSAYSLARVRSGLRDGSVSQWQAERVEQAARLLQKELDRPCVVYP